jgi:hypothetical protein
MNARPLSRASRRTFVAALAAAAVGVLPALAYGQTAVIPSGTDGSDVPPPQQVLPPPQTAPQAPVALPPGTRIVTSGDTTFVILPDSAPAAPPPVAPPVAPRPVLTPVTVTSQNGAWYGWQTLLADGAGILITGASESPVGFVAGSFIAPPVIHLAHGRPLAALESGSLRLGLPLAGGLVGAGIMANSNDEYAVLGGVAIGATLGYLTAVVVDAAVLSYEKPTGPGAAIVGKRPHSPGVILQPTFQARKSGGEIGVVGAF